MSEQVRPRGWKIPSDSVLWLQSIEAASQLRAVCETFVRHLVMLLYQCYGYDTNAQQQRFKKQH